MKRIIFAASILLFLINVSVADDIADSIGTATGFTAILTINADGTIGECIGDPPTCKEMIEEHKADMVDSEKEYSIEKTKRKYIGTAKEALILIHQNGRRWGLNEQFIEECRVAYNNINIKAQ